VYNRLCDVSVTPPEVRSDISFTVGRDGVERDQRNVEKSVIGCCQVMCRPIRCRQLWCVG